MKRPVRNPGTVLSTRLAFLFMFTLFYWVFHFIYQKMNLQLSQLVFNLAAGIFAGAVIHVATVKIIGPLFLGRGFCGWACWNALVFEVLPVKAKRKYVPEKYLSLKYLVLILVIFFSFMLVLNGLKFQSKTSQFNWLLAENALIFILGIVLTFVLGDRRAFCKYLCPAGALMTFTSPYSVLKVEKNHLKCTKCGRCEEVCPMDVPVTNFILSNRRVDHPECIMCTECIAVCPAKCLTLGMGRKSSTTPELGRPC